MMMITTTTKEKTDGNARESKKTDTEPDLESTSECVDLSHLAELFALCTPV